MIDTIGFGKLFGSVTINLKDNINMVILSMNLFDWPILVTINESKGHGLQNDMYIDGDWCTKYIWKPDFDRALGISFAGIYWEIPEDTPQLQNKKDSNFVI
jgi:hypothetical protein